ncbi:hypothetical protein SISSUDRAFT_623650 [Sistotremastrum suecicum HHB10207 ss-3]|uniref:HBS1-like protein N-terminal domain-containing protein n=1 Tax=Sistotremastrum suecicum HHB10207 ss-3 TaxID=1314776 RepID=A0A166EIM0_9AGAM|nr:hypothetical protein SISSUDRAFT_623650 [Sistotremastrum suecicum HHB10207 ss-3]
MSRHRFVKNLNIHDELAVDRYDEEDVDEIPQMTPEQRVQLDSASAEVRRLLGPEDTSGFSNDDIRAAVWDSYFDVEESVKWLLGTLVHSESVEGNADHSKTNKQRLENERVSPLSLFTLFYSPLSLVPQLARPMHPKSQSSRLPCYLFVSCIEVAFI